jgi:hypothetical protein
MDSTNPRRAARWAGIAGLVAAGAIGGAVVAGSFNANAATSTVSGSGSSTTSTAATSDQTPSSSTTGQPSPGNFPQHGTQAHESQEKPVTGTNATKAQAAAVKAAGGGTAGAVTTDMTQQGYEVTVTKSDGSTVEIHLDSSFAVEDHGPIGR